MSQTRLISHNVYYVKQRLCAVPGSGTSAPRASASCAAAAASPAKRARPSSVSGCVPSTTGKPAAAAFRSVPCACCASCAWATSARCATTGPAGRSTVWACTTPPGVPPRSAPCPLGFLLAISDDNRLTAASASCPSRRGLWLLNSLLRGFPRRQPATTKHETIRQRPDAVTPCLVGTELGGVGDLATQHFQP